MLMGMVDIARIRCGGVDSGTSLHFTDDSIGGGASCHMDMADVHMAPHIAHAVVTIYTHHFPVVHVLSSHIHAVLPYKGDA